VWIYFEQDITRHLKQTLQSKEEITRRSRSCNQGDSFRNGMVPHSSTRIPPRPSSAYY